MIEKMTEFLRNLPSKQCCDCGMTIHEQHESYLNHCDHCLHEIK